MIPRVSRVFYAAAAPESPRRNARILVASHSGISTDPQSGGGSASVVYAFEPPYGSFRSA